MAAGTPVVAADAGALPETCGGAAVLAEPDGEAFAAALTALVADEGERARLRARGHRARRRLLLGRHRARRRRAAVQPWRSARPVRTNARSAGALTRLPSRTRRRPDQPNALGPCSADSHVYQ